MNRPTPDPCQEGSRHLSASCDFRSSKGSRHLSASCPFPSWEGLGVGSWSRCLRESERRLTINQPAHREVLECASPLALSDLVRGRKSGRGMPQSKTLARLRRPHRGSWSQCMRESERRLSMNLPRSGPATRIGSTIKSGADRLNARQARRL